MRKPQSSEDAALICLINAWNELCPESDKGKANKIIREMIGDGRTKREQALAVINALHDGLAYDNWPSVIARLRGR